MHTLNKIKHKFKKTLQATKTPYALYDEQMHGKFSQIFLTYR